MKLNWDRDSNLCTNSYTNLSVQRNHLLQAFISISILKLIKHRLSLDLRINRPGSQSLNRDTGSDGSRTKRILKLTKINNASKI